ncbi:hypothetical protein J2Y74_002310 [Pseudomonas migulae]|uniref:hypothetical protein n=1 Tax=Pseudomonas migulae TaxID=78543 RepID=UPI00209E8B9F|nr:hypothetical protein [Pseudomonas migulae]MCP1518000.1 hypothetical protein [Pseudomonas migulae]
MSYLKAPDVVALIDKKVYKISTPGSVNNTTKPGDEIVAYSYFNKQQITVASHQVESAGEGLSFTVQWGNDHLGDPAVFSYSLRDTAGKKLNSEGTIVSPISS